MPALDQLPASIDSWSRALFDRPNDLRISRLSGGANNLVYLGDDGVRRLILKVYPQSGDQGDQRFRAESEFLALATEVAAPLVPRVVASDRDRRAIAMEELVGTPFSEQFPPATEDIAAAARLLTLINEDSARAKSRVSSAAADGFHVLTEHRHNIAQRLDELTANHLSGPERTDATALIADTRRTFEIACRGLDDELRLGAIDDRLDSSLLCVSPSDFGFHNAIRSALGARFFDFEFAGWDDPAKCLCDFFLQPRIPVSPEHHALISAALAPRIPIELLRRRAAVLRPLLEVKWLTIVLAVLRPARLADMLAVRGAADRDSLVAERFARARRILNRVS